jgi:hypothetical protein
MSTDPFANIVSFDLESTGLQAHDTITAVALVGPDFEIPFTFGPSDSFQENRTAIVDILDRAELLCSFNGPSFDIPMLQRCFELDDNTVGSWMLKLVDPLYAAKGLLGTKACCKLDIALALNGLQAKTGSGLEAVKLAHEGRWEELASYCLSDTKLTRELMLCRPIFWENDLQYAPLTRGVWNQQFTR